MPLPRPLRAVANKAFQMTCTKCGCNPTYGNVSATLCHACYISDRREKRIARKAAGGRKSYESAGYRRLQGEREAARQGRTLCDYVPRDERARLAAVRAAVWIPEDAAKRLRRRFFRSLLKEFNRIAAKAFPEVASALRKENAAHSRKKYQRDLAQERLRTATYKATHRTSRHAKHASTRLAMGLPQRRASSRPSLRRHAVHIAIAHLRMRRSRRTTWWRSATEASTACATS